MKKITLLLPFLILILSCSSDDDSINTDEIFGTWTVVNRDYIIQGGTTLYPINLDKEVSLIINNDSTIVINDSILNIHTTGFLSPIILNSTTSNTGLYINLLNFDEWTYSVSKTLDNTDTLYTSNTIHEPSGEAKVYLDKLLRVDY